MDGRIDVRKDIIEEYWIEFLTAIKKSREQQRAENLKRQKRRCEALSKGEEPFRDYLNEPQCEVRESSSYYVSTDSFWEWYINEKVEVK